MKSRILTIAFLTLSFSISLIGQTNTGVSKSTGTVSNGTLENGYKFKKKGNNYRFFSAFDYYILRRCYVHSEIYQIITETYKNLEKEYPGYTFCIMEASLKKGGRPFPHRTHQNGTSVDFMTPLLKDDIPTPKYSRSGLLVYLMNFDENGYLKRNTRISIDFDKMARHILELEKVANKNDYGIKKVILETNLKDEIFKSKYGDELKSKNIYFVRSLPKNIDVLHDDHYHIDFEKL